MIAPQGMDYRIIYVGAALTNASGGMREFVPAFKQQLRNRTTDSIVLRWVGMDTEVTEGFYARDLGNVDMCDVMIAIVDEPSIGLGMELARAISENKPILCLAREGNKVSRMVQAAAIEGLLELSTYRDLNDAAETAAGFIEERVGAVEV